MKLLNINTLLSISIAFTLTGCIDGYKPTTMNIKAQKPIDKQKLFEVAKNASESFDTKTNAVRTFQEHISPTSQIVHLYDYITLFEVDENNTVTSLTGCKDTQVNPNSYQKHYDKFGRATSWELIRGQVYNFSCNYGKMTSGKQDGSKTHLEEVTKVQNAIVDYLKNDGNL